MSRQDMVGLSEMVVKDRHPSRHRLCCQHERDLYILYAPAKHTCNNSTVSAKCYSGNAI